MQTLELNKMGLAPITENEMQEIDGGLIWFVVGACLLLASCVQSNKQSGHHNTQINHQTNGQNVGDSIHNSNHGHLHVTPKIK
jgi:hypothetical protein